MKLLAFIFALLFTISTQATLELNSSPFATHVAYFDITTFPWTASTEQITDAFNVCAKLLSYFDVNLTTILPPPQPNVAWVVLGGPLVQPGNIAGQSVIGNYTVGTQYNTRDLIISAFAAKVYADGLNNDALQVGWAAAHELGHQWGLYHQTNGIMVPVLGTELPSVPWPDETNSLGLPQDSYGFLGNRIGFASPVPEPYSLLFLLALLMQRRRIQ